MSSNETADDHVRSSYWKAVKLSVAVAFIRMKPLELSGEQYALQLHASFWKSRLKSSMHEQTNRYSCILVHDSEKYNKNVKLFPFINENADLNELVVNLSRFESIKCCFKSSCQNSSRAAKLSNKNMEKELLQVCLSIGQILKEVLSNKVNKRFYNVISVAVATLLNGITIFQNLDSFIMDIRQKSLHVIVSETVEFIAKLFLAIMNNHEPNYKFLQLCFSYMCDFLNCSSVNLAVAKQALYWICWVKQRLILIASKKLSLDDDTIFYLNNVSYMFRLFEHLLAQYMQHMSLKKSCNKDAQSPNTPLSASIFCAGSVNLDFFLHAQEQLQDNIFQCSGRFPLFSNWVFQLSFKMSMLLENHEF